MSKKKFENTIYNERTWLNDETTPSSGSVVCYHGVCRWPEEKEEFDNMFLEVADCHVKARLHKTTFETTEQFINKLKRLRNEVNHFIEHLEECQQPIKK